MRDALFGPSPRGEKTKRLIGPDYASGKGCYDHVLFLTKEHIRNIFASTQEVTMTNWLKDMAGGVILLVFVGSSFGLADMAQAVLARA